MDKLSIGVIFGGNSTEYEISLISASSVLRNIDRERFDVVMIGISRDGRWFTYYGDIDSIENGSWIDSDKKVPAFISPDSNRKALFEIKSDRLCPIKLDAVFPVLHGKNGEDGTVQGLLSLAGIPFVGCGVLTSAVCMDKELTHIVLTHHGIPNAKWCCIKDCELDSFDGFEADAKEKLGYPMFVKPANAGSSVGISKAKNKVELRRAVELALTVDSKVVIEEFISGKEVECAVMGNQNPTASVLGEIVPCNDFYDYEAKYKSDSKTFIPARVDEKTARLVQETAIKAYRCLGCRGLTRIDFFVCDGEKIILNEPNTMPGFTSISMYPKLRQYDGTTYKELITKLILLALE